MKTLTQYAIPLSGLKAGQHEYRFSADWRFFEQFDSSPVQQGRFDVKLALDKQSDHMIVEIHISGEMDSDCDRCLAPISLPITGRHTVIVKYEVGEERLDPNDPDVLYLDPDTHHWNVAGLIYEFILLSIPVRHVYDCEGEEVAPCDRKTLERLSSEEVQSEGNNPFRDVLHDFKTKK